MSGLSYKNDCFFASFHELNLFWGCPDDSNSIQKSQLDNIFGNNFENALKCRVAVHCVQEQSNVLFMAAV